MPTPRHSPWIRAALIVGVVYCLIGSLFGLPTSHVRVWRVMAWVVSGAVYAAHIGYEHVRLRHSPWAIAAHAAVAVAIGAIGLAVIGMTHALWVTSSISPLWLLALVIWPAATAAPAFVVALGIALVGRAATRDPADALREE